MYAMALILAMGLGGAVGYHPYATHHHHCMARRPRPVRASTAAMRIRRSPGMALA
jgi:hypothetical protein